MFYLYNANYFLIFWGFPGPGPGPQHLHWNRIRAQGPRQFLGPLPGPGACETKTIKKPTHILAILIGNTSIYQQSFVISFFLFFIMLVERCAKHIAANRGIYEEIIQLILPEHVFGCCLICALGSCSGVQNTRWRLILI